MISKHPNFVRIAALQAEINRLSDEAATPILDEVFKYKAANGTMPNISKVARAHGVTQSWLSKRVIAEVNRRKVGSFTLKNLGSYFLEEWRVKF